MKQPDAIATEKAWRRTRQVRPEPDVPEEGGSWGPAMAALPSDRHRAFVLALFEVKPGYGANVAAPKIAGFGKPTSTTQDDALAGRCLARHFRFMLWRTTSVPKAAASRLY
jgi:hypothetical protein